MEDKNKVNQPAGENKDDAVKKESTVQRLLNRGVLKRFFNKSQERSISGKESRRITKENFAITRGYEKRKKRKNVPESEYVTQMKDDRNIVEFDNLHTYFFTDAGTVRAVNGVTFSIPQGSTVGVVGESGCGKSVTSLSLMQLVQAPHGQVIYDDKIQSEIRFKSTVFKEVDGKKVPIYEYVTNTEGEQVIKMRPVAKGNVVVKDKDGKPLMEPVRKTDASGAPIFETGPNDKEIPVYDYIPGANNRQTIKMRPLTNNGAPVLDKNGRPLSEPVQKQDDSGNPVFVLAASGESVPVYESIAGQQGVPAVRIRQAVRRGAPVLGKDGKPMMEPVQKVSASGLPLFETEEKVYNVARMPASKMREIRGREITMIFQEPMTSLNPIFRIGDQLDEVVLLHAPGATKASAKARTYEMLNLVGIIPENVYRRYPHELSGGMRQRVVIAMALMCNPKLIIADEPTTALDVTIQAQILELLRNIKDEISGSIMLITHDLGVIAEMADYVVVMYAGRIVEMGTVYEIFKESMHPYAIGLQKSKPSITTKVDRLYSIPGSVPNPINMPNHCYFKGRCAQRTEACNCEYPPMLSVSPTHKVACHLYTGKYPVDNDSLMELPSAEGSKEVK